MKFLKLFFILSFMAFASSVIAANLNVKQQGAVRFWDTSNGNYVALRAASSISSDITWLLPSADGASGQALTTNGAGTLAWSTITATPEFTPTTISTDTTLSTETFIVCDVDSAGADITLTLPLTSVSTTIQYYVSVANSTSDSKCILDPAGSDTIIGRSALNIFGDNKSVIIANVGGVNGDWKTYAENLSNVIIFRDSKSAGAAGGSATANTWVTRTITTQVGLTSIASHSANVISLLTDGDWVIDISAPGYRTGEHKIKLRNDPSGGPSDVAIGSSEHSDTGGATQTRSRLTHSFTTSVATNYDVQHRAAANTTGNDFGLANNMGVTEEYMIIKLERLR